MSMTAEEVPAPSFRFRPTKRELVEFYLLPRARGEDPFPGVIIEDDAAGSSLPWDLFERHGLGSEDEAYFIVRASDAKKPGGRQDRRCDGGAGAWKMQSRLEKGLRVRGEGIRCHLSTLNLHMGTGKKGGSVGWVMHEYTIAAPPCLSLVKICHIAFTGHGQKRKRVPDVIQEGCQSGHALVDATAASGSALPCPQAVPDPESGAVYSSGDEERMHLEEHARTTEQQDMVVPQLMVQPSRQLSAGELEFWSSIGVDVESNEQGPEQEQPWSSVGVQSNSVLPNISGMAGGPKDHQVPDVQNNCAVPDFGNMATGSLGGGGFSLICS